MILHDRDGIILQEQSDDKGWEGEEEGREGGGRRRGGEGEEKFCYSAHQDSTACWIRLPGTVSICHTTLRGIDLQVVMNTLKTHKPHTLASSHSQVEE